MLIGFNSSIDVCRVLSINKIAGAKNLFMETYLCLNMDVSCGYIGEALNPEGGSVSHSVM